MDTFARLTLISAFGVLVLAGCSAQNGASGTMIRDYDLSSLESYMGDATQDAPAAKMQSTSFESNQTSQDESTQVYEGIYGEWVTDMDLGSELDEAMQESPGAGEKSDEAMAEMGEQMARAMVEMMAAMFSMSLNIDEDGTFEMTAFYMPFEGSWVRDGDDIILTPETVMGFTADQQEELKEAMEAQSEEGSNVTTSFNGDWEPMTLRVTEDGSALVVIKQKEDEMELVFRRKS